MYETERKQIKQNQEFLQALRAAADNDETAQQFFDSTVIVYINGNKIETAMSYQLMSALLNTLERDLYNLDVCEFDTATADKLHPSFKYEY